MTRHVPDQNKHNIDSSVTLLAAMSNPSRLRILKIISVSEAAVGPLSDMIGLSQSATSQHLAKLRPAGVVSSRRDLHQVYYSCRSKSALRILVLLETLFPAEFLPAEAA